MSSLLASDPFSPPTSTIVPSTEDLEDALVYGSGALALATFLGGSFGGALLVGLNGWRTEQPVAAAFLGFGQAALVTVLILTLPLELSWFPATALQVGVVQVVNRYLLADRIESRTLALELGDAPPLQHAPWWHAIPFGLLGLVPAMAFTLLLVGLMWMLGLPIDWA